MIKWEWLPRFVAMKEANGQVQKLTLGDGSNGGSAISESAGHPYPEEELIDEEYDQAAYPASRRKLPYVGRGVVGTKEDPNLQQSSRGKNDRSVNIEFRNVPLGVRNGAAILPRPKLRGRRSTVGAEDSFE